MAIQGTTLAEVIGEALMDNSASNEVVRYSFSGDLGIACRFSQTDVSSAAWGRDEGGKPAYSISRVGFDIEPVDVSIRPLEDK